MMHEFYGPKLVQAFRDIKDIFDPDGLFNPGIITTDPGMTDNLRLAPGGAPPPPGGSGSISDSRESLSSRLLCKLEPR